MGSLADFDELQAPFHRILSKPAGGNAYPFSVRRSLSGIINQEEEVLKQQGDDSIEAVEESYAEIENTRDESAVGTNRMVHIEGIVPSQDTVNITEQHAMEITNALHHKGKKYEDPNHRRFYEGRGKIESQSF